MMPTLMILGGMLLMLAPAIEEGIIFPFAGAHAALIRAFKAEPTPADMMQMLDGLDDPKVQPIRRGMT